MGSFTTESPPVPTIFRATRPLAFVLACVGLAGCASEFAVPVAGTIGTDAAQGETVARMKGDSTFQVSTLGGLTCGGTYDAHDMSPTMTVPVTCNDGRHGALMVTRSMTGISGTAIGRLNDGTEGHFVFGDLVFNQEGNTWTR
ncbi:MAG: hypothetical protein BWX69_03145 [Planctomycetes bacterium ADurb.Bin069]|nr:MAG: hypothetical protein BWX69_03145 [Planctomycetes bacterium ADurb.Bin069]